MSLEEKKNELINEATGELDDSVLDDVSGGIQTGAAGAAGAAGKAIVKGAAVKAGATGAACAAGKAGKAVKSVKSGKATVIYSEGGKGGLTKKGM